LFKLKGKLLIVGPKFHVSASSIASRYEDKDIILNGADNSLADKITDSPGQPVTVQAKVDAPGWYYIGVMDLNGNSHPDPYAFRVTWRNRSSRLRDEVQVTLRT